MDDVKDKMKGFMKKVNNPFSASSSGKFKGQGRVLGSSSSGPANPTPGRPSQPVDSRLNQRPTAPVSSKPLIPKSADSDYQVPNNKSAIESTSGSTCKPSNGFDPFDSMITTGKRNANGYSLDVFECPVCGRGYGSEDEVSAHVESCLNDSESKATASLSELTINEDGAEPLSELRACVGAYVSSNPSAGSIEVLLRLLQNIVKEPENSKFRKIRMGNPKIREAVGDVAGGVELLECVGFNLQEEGGEIWAAMDVPSEEKLNVIKKAISYLEPQKAKDVPSPAPAKTEEPVEPKKIDRQIRVFFSVSENLAGKIEVPDSFYNLSAEELKREADMRKKKIAESQLLIPRSYKEKLAKAGRKRYKRTLIRVQFPDGVVLQGVFAPWEPTTALYEFVSSALKAPSLEFELLHPVVVKRRVIPHFPSREGERAPTLDDEDLVPSALIKFKHIETDSNVFTGLCNELLEISEPLV